MYLALQQRGKSLREAATDTLLVWIQSFIFTSPLICMTSLGTTFQRPVCWRRCLCFHSSLQHLTVSQCLSQLLWNTEAGTLFPGRLYTSDTLLWSLSCEGACIRSQVVINATETQARTITSYPCGSCIRYKPTDSFSADLSRPARHVSCPKRTVFVFQ